MSWPENNSKICLHLSFHCWRGRMGREHYRKRDDPV